MEYKYIAVEYTYMCGKETRTSYGIAYACVSDGIVNILQSVQDITSDRNKVEQLVELCCELQLDPIHMSDVIDDFMADICEYLQKHLH